MRESSVWLARDSHNPQAEEKNFWVFLYIERGDERSDPGLYKLFDNLVFSSSVKRLFMCISNVDAPTHPPQKNEEKVYAQRALS